MPSPGTNTVPLQEEGERNYDGRRERVGAKTMDGVRKGKSEDRSGGVESKRERGGRRAAN